jgi:hypothetical protein
MGDVREDAATKRCKDHSLVLPQPQQRPFRSFPREGRALMPPPRRARVLVTIRTL